MDNYTFQHAECLYSHSHQFFSETLSHKILQIRIEAQLKGIDTSIAIDDIEFRPDGRMQMEPSPTVPRDEVCWNDGDFILSIVQHHHHHCCCAPGMYISLLPHRLNNN